MTLCKLYL